MKRLLIFIAVMPLFLKAQEKGVIFVNDSLTWQQILAKAKAEDKCVFVDCYATYCLPCKIMDKEVYPNAAVGSYLNKYFVSVRIQMDSTADDNDQVKKWYKTARAIRKKYQPHGYPTFLFFNPEGNLIYRDGEQKNVDEFLDMVMTVDLESDLWKGNDPLADDPDWDVMKVSLFKKWQSVRTDEIIGAYKIQFYKRLRNWPEYEKLLKESIRNHPPQKEAEEQGYNKSAHKLNKELWDIFQYCTDRSILKKALSWSRKCIRVESNHEVVYDYYDTYANLLYKLGRKKRAIVKEEKALRFTPDNKKTDMENTLDKMRKGKPTW